MMFCIIAKPRAPLCSFDLNCSDSMIAAGAELLEEEEDAYLFFWYERTRTSSSLNVTSPVCIANYARPYMWNV